MSYGTSLYDKINFFYIAANFNSLGGIRIVSENFGKIFLTFLGLGTNVVKVSSVNSELLFQSDTLRNWYQNRIFPELSQEPLLPEPVPPSLARTLIFVSSIEIHSYSKHIGLFHGGNLVWFESVIEDGSPNSGIHLNSCQKISTLTNQKWATNLYQYTDLTCY